MLFLPCSIDNNPNIINHLPLFVSILLVLPNHVNSNCSDIILFEQHYNFKHLEKSSAARKLDSNQNNPVIIQPSVNYRSIFLKKNRNLQDFKLLCLLSRTR